MNLCRNGCKIHLNGFTEAKKTQEGNSSFKIIEDQAHIDLISFFLAYNFNLVHHQKNVRIFLSVMSSLCINTFLICCHPKKILFDMNCDDILTKISFWMNESNKKEITCLIPGSINAALISFIILKMHQLSREIRNFRWKWSTLQFQTQRTFLRLGFIQRLSAHWNSNFCFALSHWFQIDCSAKAEKC